MRGKMIGFLSFYLENELILELKNQNSGHLFYILKKATRDFLKQKSTMDDTLDEEFSRIQISGQVL